MWFNTPHFSYFYSVIGLGGIISLALCSYLLRYANGLIVPIINCLTCFCHTNPVERNHREAGPGPSVKYNSRRETCYVDVSEQSQDRVSASAVSSHKIIKASGLPPLIINN